MTQNHLDGGGKGLTSSRPKHAANSGRGSRNAWAETGEQVNRFLSGWASTYAGIGINS